MSGASRPDRNILKKATTSIYESQCLQYNPVCGAGKEGSVAFSEMSNNFIAQISSPKLW